MLFVTLHHVPDLTKTINELARALRPGGFLIIREHNCETQYSVVPKYLNFVHAIMMIAKVGEFAHMPDESTDENHEDQWKKQKKNILEYTKSNQYRTKSQWDREFSRVGFAPLVKLDYDVSRTPNPQHLFYGLYQLT